MCYGEIAPKSNAPVGADTRVTFADETAPTELRFHRADPLSAELVREAQAEAAIGFPNEMAAISTVSVASTTGSGFHGGGSSCERGWTAAKPFRTDRGERAAVDSIIIPSSPARPRR